MTVGTVAYSAPEQLKGDSVDGHADQYALAATAYHLLTGMPPFQHTQTRDRHQPASQLGAPEIGTRRLHFPAWARCSTKGLAKDPADRFDRCIDFARALQHRLSSPLVTWAPPSSLRFRHPPR